MSNCKRWRKKHHHVSPLAHVITKVDRIIYGNVLKKENQLHSFGEVILSTQVCTRRSECPRRRMFFSTLSSFTNYFFTPQDFKTSTDWSTFPPRLPRRVCGTPERVRESYKLQLANPDYQSLLKTNLTVFGTIDGMLSSIRQDDILASTNSVVFSLN